MNFLLKYPTRSRPQLFQDQIALWNETASGFNRINWLVSADCDDETMHNTTINDWCAQQGITLCYSNNRTKVEACNANMDCAPPDWEVLVLVSDDMVPTVGWDQVVREHMPPDLNGGLWFPDGRQLRTCTLSIFGRPIYDWLGYVYHPEFLSVYCDNYYHWLLEQRGLLKFVNLPTFRHAWRERNNDALMKRNESRELYDADRRAFERLKLSHA